jgi:zinc protease
VSARLRSLVGGGIASSMLGLAACGGTTPPPAPPPAPAPLVATVPAPPAHELPPPSAASKPSPFPAVTREKLANGLGLAIIESHALPIVQLRVLVHAGAGYADKPAAISLTADLLKDGGTRSMSSSQLLRKVETMGANLGVGTGSDGTVFSLAVTRDHLEEATAILGEILTAPRFDRSEFTKLKTREIDEASDAARSSGSFMAMRVLTEKLFPAPSPYAVDGLLPREIAAIDEATVRATYQRWFVPRNTEVVIAGDVDPKAARAIVDKAFGGWKGGDAPAVPKTELAPRNNGAARPEGGSLHVIVADRPKSSQSDIFLAFGAPERGTPAWPDLKVATQVLGGGVSGRLFLDVREQRSLAYSAGGRLAERAHGHEASILYAGTQTPKTAEAVDGILQNVQKIATGDIDERETDTARRYLSDVFAVRLETIGAVADTVVGQDQLGLPDGYWDSYREALHHVDTAHANAAARTLFAGAGAGREAFLVIAGDAAVIVPTLIRFGEVTVVDPEHDFRVTRTVPRSAR